MTAAMQTISVKKKLRGKTRSQQLAFDIERGSRTQQQFKQDADLNVLMQRYVKQNPRDPLGFGLAIQAGMGQSGDTTSHVDLAEALNVVNASTEAFMDLDSSIRDRFNNDPLKLAKFLGEPKNQEEAYRLGLAVKPVEAPEAPPMKVHVVQTDLAEQASKGPGGAA